MDIARICLNCPPCGATGNLVLFWRKKWPLSMNYRIKFLLGFPIPHLKAYAPNFSGNMLKLARLLKFGVPPCCEVSLSGFRAPLNSCFKSIFLDKIASHGQTVHFWLYSVIHRWKALDKSFLMVFFKKYFVDPAKRQNFGDASGLKRNY